MEKAKFLVLTDYDNRGTVIKRIGRKSYQWKDKKWVRVGLIPYFYPDAPEYECYEMITEEEANRLIAEM